MRSLLPWLCRGPLLAALALPLGTVGCFGSQDPAGPGVPRVEGPIQAADIQDEHFAQNLHRVLRDGKPSPERLGVLVGVVRRQLVHAGRRFGKGKDARAMESVIGALYLVRTGEGRSEMIDATGDRALAGAIDRVSPRGDEGRAGALMRMRVAALPTGTRARAEVEQHLAALDQWMRETRTGGPMRRLGADERAAVARALVDPSEQSVSAAVNAVNAWIGRAIEYNMHFRQTGQRPEREEAVEAARALESGGATMAAIFLRNGNARGALETLDQTGARRVIQPGFYTRIKNAAVNDGARDWQALAAAFAHQDPEDRDTETDLDPHLLSAGLWGTSLEAYRRDPTNFDTSLLLARSLVRFGMPEAAPLVLHEALAQHSTPITVSASMELLLAAIGGSAEVEDIDTARRTFKSAGAVLAQADRPEFQGRIDPSTARARFMMAALEVRGGHLAEARPLLTQAVSREPSVGGFTTLAMVERQAGDAKAALAAVELALRAPDARSALLDVAEAHLVAFEVLRDGGGDRMKGSLDAALAVALAARQSRGNAATRARAERLLGRILEGYGDTKGASRAFDRALSLAASDRPTLGAAMLDAIGRALVRRDLAAARMALKRGIDGDAGEDDLVYGGLWVSLLERELKARSDGTVERALRGRPRTAWTGKLSQWAHGKLSDTDLNTAAQNASQRVEAAFYTAMARKAAGDPSADARLRSVATAPVIDLLEVQLARELTAPRVKADLPGGVQLP